MKRTQLPKGHKQTEVGVIPDWQKNTLSRLLLN